MTYEDASPLSRRTILLVDDDDVFRERLAKALVSRMYDVRTSRDAASALRLAEEESPERALVDLRMDDAFVGLEVVRGLRAIDPATEIVVLTGYGSIATALEAVKLGARDYLTKPATVEAILRAFGDVAEGARAEKPVEVPSLARVEWEHIQRVLTDCGGNVSAAARALGLHRRSLQRKLSKYPVSR